MRAPPVPWQPQQLASSYFGPAEAERLRELGGSGTDYFSPTVRLESAWETRSCERWHRRGKVLAWDASQDKKAQIEYFDYANDTTMQDLDDSTTHSHWRLPVQTKLKHHLETQPHHGFKDMDQMRIGCHALYNANV